MFDKVIIPTCIGCLLPPDSIKEYVAIAKLEGTTPIKLVMEQDGTYNRFVKDKFYCTECYIKAGQPIASRKGS
jgi:hypothetical protein